MLEGLPAHPLDVGPSRPRGEDRVVDAPGEARSGPQGQGTAHGDLRAELGGHAGSQGVDVHTHEGTAMGRVG